MENKDLEVTLTVESVIHKALREMAEAVYKEHGLRILDVRINWYDVSEFSANIPKCEISRIEVGTAS